MSFTADQVRRQFLQSASGFSLNDPSWYTKSDRRYIITYHNTSALPSCRKFSNSGVVLEVPSDKFLKKALLSLRDQLIV
ncbi:hypothetical protein WAI453_000411 [Rhynchosporium graminicola]